MHFPAYRADVYTRVYIISYNYIESRPRDKKKSRHSVEITLYNNIYERFGKQETRFSWMAKSNLSCIIIIYGCDRERKSKVERSRELAAAAFTRSSARGAFIVAILEALMSLIYCRKRGLMRWWKTQKKIYSFKLCHDDRARFCPLDYCLYCRTRAKSCAMYINARIIYIHRLFIISMSVKFMLNNKSKVRLIICIGAIAKLKYTARYGRGRTTRYKY